MGTPPLPVRSNSTMDSQGGSLYAKVEKTVRSRRAAVSAKPGVT